MKATNKIPLAFFTSSVDSNAFVKKKQDAIPKKANVSRPKENPKEYSTPFTRPYKNSIAKS
jgi:hypothetical protein